MKKRSKKSPAPETSAPTEVPAPSAPSEASAPSEPTIVSQPSAADGTPVAGTAVAPAPSTSTADLDLVAGGALVLPELRKKRRKYKAKDVERALMALAAQVNDFERAQTERVLEKLASLISIAQEEASRIKNDATEHAQHVEADVRAALTEAKAEATKILSAARTRAAEVVSEALGELGRLEDQLARVRSLAARLTDDTSRD